MRRNEKLYLLISFMLGVLMLLISYSIGSCRARSVCAAQFSEVLKENSWRYEDGKLEQNTSRIVRSNSAEVQKPDNATAFGIDISYHQGTIDWEQVKASGQVDFVIIRCGYGSDKTENDDKQWEYNVSECERLGIPYGVYLYSCATTTDGAKSEAEHVLRLIQGRNLTYPIYYDLEDNKQADLSSKQLAQMTDVFFGTLEEAGYTNVGVYANKHWFTEKLKDPLFDHFPRWVAQYASKCDYDGTYHMWQYSSKGSIPGISGNSVDFNYKIGDWTNGGGYVPAQVVLDKSSKALTVGKSTTLKATDSIRKNYKLAAVWTSSDKKIATVDSTGKVTAKSAGKVMITAKNSAGNTASCTVTVSPKANKITKIAKSGSRAIKISWSKISGTTKYQVYMSTKKSSGYKKVKTASSKTTSYTTGKLTKGKRYYFKVRSYKTINKKNYYSAYSAVQSMKL